MTRAERESSYLIPKARTFPVFQIPLMPIVANTVCLALLFVSAQRQNSTLRD